MRLIAETFTKKMLCYIFIMKNNDSLSLDVARHVQACAAGVNSGNCLKPASMIENTVKYFYPANLFSIRIEPKREKVYLARITLMSFCVVSLVLADATMLPCQIRNSNAAP
ncbi:MAG: hypothetical protein ACU83V_14390 [Gammaproteobacteria bacterium]